MWSSGKRSGSGLDTTSSSVAAKILSISCYSDHNFMTCCIPTHRLFVHVRRLVAHGHKVGVVKQTETSAIKASGANKNALFTRELTALYTKSTLVGEDVNPVCTFEDRPQGCEEGAMDPPHSCLLCISETWDKRKQLTVGLVAVQPSTGDVFLDCFSDSPSRSELEARVLKLNPVEILVSSELSELSLKLLHSITTASPHADDRARLETRDGALFDFSAALDTVTKFYAQSQGKDSQALSCVASLESPVVCCLGPLILYLQEFNLERVLRSQCNFQRLLSGSEILTLGAATLKNLEILRNQTDGMVRGSLLWVLDHTRTAFGRRLMRKWVSQPLTDPRCTNTTVCAPLLFDACGSGVVEGKKFRGCARGDLCNRKMACCGTDLCNGFAPTGPSIVLPLLASAIFTLCVL
uniref:DNA mismatch repair protein MutS core domain-containing protein n=1 Tax=Knipowitschia caucasica TaxID=637954 RepID=A0AAV2MNU6_KNICA